MTEGHPEDANVGQEDGSAIGPGSPRRLEDLPKELGVLLASVGVMGIVLPGMAGLPALLAGGLVLWPKTFGKVESWFSRRYPTTHRESMRQVGRFIDDLDRRYRFHEPTKHDCPNSESQPGGRHGRDQPEL